MWPSLPKTLTRNEVPLLFREENVERGFRTPNQPWWYYFPLSVFQLHNESMNVWSHLLALFLMSRKLYLFNMEIDFIRDPYSWPLLAGLLCGSALYACSSFAHSMQSKSELVHYTAFMFDYAGIGLYGLGSVIVHLAYCSEDNFYNLVKDFFVPIGAILAFLICFCCSVAKVIYTRPYPFVRKLWQVGPVCSIYIVLITPIAHRLYACFVNGDDCNESIPYHIRQIFFFMLSGFFFTSDMPQRFRPGRCDHFFHSHQLFHFAIMTCTIFQMDGVFIDFKTRKEVVWARPMPTFYSAFGPVIIVFIAELISIFSFYLFIIKPRVLKKK